MFFEYKRGWSSRVGMALMDLGVDVAPGSILSFWYFDWVPAEAMNSIL